MLCLLLRSGGGTRRPATATWYRAAPPRNERRRPSRRPRRPSPRRGAGSRGTSRTSRGAPRRARASARASRPRGSPSPARRTRGRRSRRSSCELLLEVALELGAHARAGAMEDHALVARRQLEQVADLLGLEPLDVAQRQHRLLRLGERSDRRAQPFARLERREPALGVLPRSRRRGPVPRPRGAVALEALRRHGRLVACPRERGEWHAAALAYAAGLRLVGEDVEQPRLEGRPLLEAVQAVDGRDPRLLHDLLGDGVGADVRAGDALEARVVAGHEGDEGVLVAGPQRVEERGVPVGRPMRGGRRCGGPYRQHSDPTVSRRAPALNGTWFAGGVGA